MLWRFSITTASQQSGNPQQVTFYLYFIPLVFIAQELYGSCCCFSSHWCRRQRLKERPPREGSNHQINICTHSLSFFLGPPELGTEPGLCHWDKHAWAGDGIHHLPVCFLNLTNLVTEFNTCIHQTLQLPLIMAS